MLFRRFACQLVPEMSQRMSEQPGYMHLADAQAPGNLVLREVSVKPEDQDPLLAFGELVQVGVDASMSMACSTACLNVPNPRRSLTEIAQELGFSEPSAFSRWFRRRFGCSPSEWRGRSQVDWPGEHGQG